MDQRPPQPPEGKLIAEAAGRLDLSIREAARRAGISYGRWRQVVQGYQNVSPGSYAVVRAPARTLARMADAVHVAPEQMEAAAQEHDSDEDRQRVTEAAGILREMQAQRTPSAEFPGESPDEPGAEVIPFPPAAADEFMQRLAAIERELGSPVNLGDRVERAIVAQFKTPRQIAVELASRRDLPNRAAEGRGTSGGR